MLEALERCPSRSPRINIPRLPSMEGDAPGKSFGALARASGVRDICTAHST